ncbi:DM13 domain-containing protein [Galbibacter mesophilus]|uniref:DM13 domain-containing protein n=1 Tax=Galbibacter mesophilus TaxID=379069 RepID=UPI00191D2AF6|nr:DM13 domain-containing protein [Galbibacter mesophilus]MCM5662207.1 DM13 domain-containing protein [Galbibacter mesophilus]
MKNFLITFLLLVVTSLCSYSQDGNSWVGKVYSVKGSWSIVENDGSYLFKLGGNFNTLPGPELKLYLSPVHITEIKDRDAIHEQGGVFIAELKSNKGSQQYKLPEGVRLEDFQSLVIHCEKFSVVWGGIDLNGD